MIEYESVLFGDGTTQEVVIECGITHRIRFPVLVDLVELWTNSYNGVSYSHNEELRGTSQFFHLFEKGRYYWYYAPYEEEDYPAVISGLRFYTPLKVKNCPDFLTKYFDVVNKNQPVVLLNENSDVLYHIKEGDSPVILQCLETVLVCVSMLKEEKKISIVPLTEISYYVSQGAHVMNELDKLQKTLLKETSDIQETLRKADEVSQKIADWQGDKPFPTGAEILAEVRKERDEKYD